MNDYESIIGHDNIIEHIKNAVVMDKISHAYIFNGEKGAGKKTLARAFAKTLQCEKGESESCGVCHSCIQTDSGNQPDIIWISHDKPSSIGVDDLREQLIGDIQIKPYSSRYKIYIIDEAEKMTVQAQNAVLKTIEEPPAYGIIIFLTTNVEVFLPTILSRCIVFNLRPVSDELIIKYLIENYKVPDYQAKMCASFAQGRLGKAIDLASSEYFNQIKDEAVRILRQLYTMDIADITEAVKRITEYKITIDDLFDIMIMWFRDVLLFKVTKDPNVIIFKDYINDIRKQAGRSSYEGIEAIIEGFNKAKARLKANVNFELTMELMLLTIKEN